MDQASLISGCDCSVTRLYRMLKIYCPCPRKTLNLTWLISDRKSCADTCSILPFVKKKEKEECSVKFVEIILHGFYSFDQWLFYNYLRKTCIVLKTYGDTSEFRAGVNTQYFMELVAC